MIQRIPPRVADKEVCGSIIIEISGRDPIAKIQLRSREPGFRRHILKCAVSLITQQTVVEGGILFPEFRQPGAIGQVDVHPAVIIKVQNRDTAAHRLLKVFPASEVIVCGVGDP